MLARSAFLHRAGFEERCRRVKSRKREKTETCQTNLNKNMRMMATKGRFSLFIQVRRAGLPYCLDREVTAGFVHHT